MPSIDTFVGFSTVPEGLEEFLVAQGYVPDSEGKPNQYEHGQQDYPWIFYNHPLPAPEPDTVPDWSKAGMDIVATLMIYDKGDDYELPEILATALAKKYNAIVYDTGLDEFFEAKDL